MSTSTNSLAQRRSLDDWLDRLEAEWQKGGAPNFRAYLTGPGPTGHEYLCDLLELDLEYRWKTYSGVKSLDKTGFPKYPTLQDYAVAFRLDMRLLSSAEMLAREYRVRMRWGDRPGRTPYKERCSSPHSELEVTLDQVDVELSIECTHRLPPSDAVPLQEAPTMTLAPRHTVSGALPGSGPLPTSIGKYQLLSRLGRGGFAEVWRARDPDLNREIAIKIPRGDTPLSREVVRASKQEARKLAELSGIPGIVTVYEAGESEGLFYIVSELVEGESLRERIQHEKLAIQATLELVASVAEILHQAHLKNIAHRDIKPDNILLDANNRPTLIDFGLAVTEEEKFRENEHLVGTLPYMSPEQISGNNRFANTQVDIYGLGVVLYRMLTGKLPFEAASVTDFEQLINHGVPRTPRTIDDSIPVEVEAICLKCLEKDPGDRYTSAAEFADKLRACIAPSPSMSASQKVGLLALFLLACVGLFLAIDPFGKKQEPLPTPPPGRKGTIDAHQRANVTIPVPLENAKELFRSSSEKTSIVEPKPNSLVMDTQYPMALGLCEIDAASYRVRIRVRLESYSGLRTSTFGMLLGYREVNGRYRYQTVQLERRKKIDPYCIRTIAEGTPGAPPQSSRKSSPDSLPPIEPGIHTLDVTVGHGIELVRWNARSLPVLSSTETNELTIPGDYAGTIGVINSRGAVEVLSCTVTILRRQW